MAQLTGDKFRALFPDIKGHELDGAHERLRRYFSIVVNISRNDQRRAQQSLTESPTGGNVNAGQVDPSTFSTKFG
jgi:hypothetical protein